MDKVKFLYHSKACKTDFYQISFYYVSDIRTKNLYHTSEA